MGAVKQKEQSVPVSPKNEPIVQSVSTFHVLPESPHSDAGVKMRVPVSLARSQHRGPDLSQTVIGLSL